MVPAGELQVWQAEPAPGERLDRYLARVSGYSRSLIQALIGSGCVTVSGRPARPSYLVSAGDTVTLRLPEPGPSGGDLDIPPLPEVIYEDAALLVLNKPAGLTVHPGAGTTTATLLQSLVEYRPELLKFTWPDPARPGIVHRLDKDTSGILLVALNPTAQAAMQAQFKAHSIQKTYLAVLHGHLQPDEGTIDAPLGRHPTRRVKRAVVAEGRPAQTRYQVIERFEQACYVKAWPLSGRTHQIRVHFAALGHAVVGDRLYGPRRSALTAARQMLHAWRISLVHPVNGENLSFEAPLPPDFSELLTFLRRAC
ncbi:MAG: RluA family pseudouridine synthase [Anaerolineae bacterium]